MNSRNSQVRTCSPSISPVTASLNEIREAGRPVHSKDEASAAERNYLSHFGLHQADEVDHRFGYLACGDVDVFMHRCEPPNPKRVVVSHGYYDHTGTWKHAISALLAAGNAVVIYDQPGHGLSGGERATVDDFHEYIDVLETMVGRCQEESSKNLPIVLAGHSMGCAVISDYLLERRGDATGAVLISPLIRSAAWVPSKVGHAAVGWVLPSVPRVFMQNSADEDYLQFVKDDPLHHREVPFAWTKALFEWNRRAETFEPRDDCEVHILQGEADSTVDWKFNLAFLGEKFPRSTVDRFEGGEHQLLNEAPPLRSAVLEELVTAVAGFPGDEDT